MNFIYFKISSQVLKPVTPGRNFLLNTRLKLIMCKLGTRQIPALGGRTGRPPLSPAILAPVQLNVPRPFLRQPVAPLFLLRLFPHFFDGVFLLDLRARNPTIRVFLVIFLGDLRSLTSRIFLCDDFSHMQRSEV